MLSLHSKRNDFIEVDGVDYPVDFSFNRVLANMELSQDVNISDRTKVQLYLRNYLRMTKLELSETKWSIKKMSEIYMMITMMLFKEEVAQVNKKQNKKNDKSVYSFSEDADFIFSSFLKDYQINLLDCRDNMHWDEFKALFVSLSQDTKMAEVMRIRQWKKGEHDSKEYCARMTELQQVYALKQSQEEYETIELERQKMANMTSDERISYAKEQLRILEKGG